MCVLTCSEKENMVLAESGRNYLCISLVLVKVLSFK